MTFVILFAFAVIVGSLTVHRIRADFNREVAASASDLADLLRIEVKGSSIEGYYVVVQPNLDEFAASEHAVVRILSFSGTVLASTTHAPDLGLVNETYVGGYRVHTTLYPLRGASGGALYVQYARPAAGMQDTIDRVRLLLILGVLVGTGLAGLVGLSIARRAMSPIAQLTSTAAEIAKTRDPSRSVPQPEADDEVAELARTLQSMLRELDSAHAETEAILARQRQFVADASHELRTPLTSVLANLELLAETLQGEQGEAATSALRSSKRMRRLVADLLLLARTDVGRVVPREPVDLDQIVVEAAAELGPVSSSHELFLELEPVTVEAVGDELHRLTINLIENALRHTPPGTSIWVRTDTAQGQARLVVEDNGPGIPERLRSTLFERFVRGVGDRGGSFGLGLAIVRAVAESHGGSVTVEGAHRNGLERGARFMVLLPRLAAPAEGPERLSSAARSV
ncbi:MAG TPA: HAMP domain-containing sensor histidine kinase [Solirubrobacteraceae bacterium]|jgi:signal transduction histidine kinase